MFYFYQIGGAQPQFCPEAAAIVKRERTQTLVPALAATAGIIRCSLLRSQSTFYY